LVESAVAHGTDPTQLDRQLHIWGIADDVLRDLYVRGKYRDVTLAAAIRLDTWPLNEARGTGSPRIPTTRVYQYGPACVRDSRDLKAALATLTERGRARLEEEGRRRFVTVNPALLDG
jgi:hypothetical protein